MIDIYDAAGVTGAVLVIAVYFATQQRWLSSEDWRYPAVNLLGAVFILISLVAHWNLAAFVIEIFWMAISLYGLGRSLRSA